MLLRRTSVHIASRHSASQRGRESCEMESMAARTSHLKVRVFKDHHCVICILLWLDHAAAATTSEVCKCAPTCSLLVAVSTDDHDRCSVSSTAQFLLTVISFGASSIRLRVAKRVRLSCSVKSRFSRSCVTMWSTLARPRHTCRHHTLHRWSSCLMSSTTRSWTPLVSSDNCI